MCRADDYKSFMDCVQNCGVLYELDNSVARLLKKITEQTFEKITKGVGAQTLSVDDQFNAAGGGEVDEDDLC